MLKLWRPLRKIGRRIGRIWSNVKWFIIGFFLLVSFMFGLWGVNPAGEKQCSVQKLLTNCPPVIYETLQLITMDGDTEDINWQMDVSIVLAFFTIILTGWETFAFLFRDQWRKIYLSLLIKEHIVICGLGQKGISFAKSFLESGQEVVVIEEKKGTPLITKCEDEGGIVLIGNATSQDMLKRSAVQKARYLIAVCGDDDINFEIAMFAKTITKRRNSGELTCMIHVTDLDPDFYSWQKAIREPNKQAFELVMFDVFREGGRILLHKCATFQWASGIPGNTPPHILIIGGGKLAEALVLQAAAQWSYRRRAAERWSYKDNQIPLVISMVAPQMEEKKNRIQEGLPPSARDSSIFKLKPVEGGDMHPATIRRTVENHLKPTELEQEKTKLMVYVCEGGDMHPATIRRTVENHLKPTELEQEKTKLMVYVCMDDDSQGLLTGVTLSRAYPKGSIEKIIVRMKEDAEFDLSGYGETESVESFALLEQVCTAKFIEHGYGEHIARALYRQSVRKKISEHTKDSQQSWEEREKKTAERVTIRPWSECAPSDQGNFRKGAGTIKNRIEKDDQKREYYLGTATSWENAKPVVYTKTEGIHRLGLEQEGLLDDILDDLLLQERVQVYPRQEG